MSYSEKDGQVILTMSREDYNLLLMMLGTATAATMPDGVLKSVPLLIYPTSEDLALWNRGRRDSLERMLQFMNRLNSGNPNYTPYQVEEKRGGKRKHLHVCNFPQHIPQQHGERWTCPECGSVMEYNAGECWWERVSL
jgi:ribosomal protein S27AE